MARIAAFVALALLACSVVVAESQSAYTEEQINTLDERVGRCVEDVPALGDFDYPGYNCQLDGYLALVTKGIQKEAVTKVVVDCLKSRPLDTDVITSVEQCLVKAMARDV